MNDSQKIEEYEKIIEANKVLIEYARENNLNIEEIKKFLEDSTKFYKKVKSFI